jgi:DNA-binding transcriptional LysR family regulator
MNFTKAANRLFISHSTISRNISALERDLEAKLFVRDRNHRVRLTSAGELLADKADKLFQTIEQLQTDVRMADSPSIGQLSFASIGFYSHVINRCYREFSMAHRDYELFISSMPIKLIFPMVSSGQADFGLTFSFAMDADMGGCDVFTLESGEFKVIVSTESPLAEMESININDPRLASPIILKSTPFPFESDIERHRSHAYDKQTLASSFETLFLLVKADFGFALVPQHIACNAGTGCTQLRIEGIDTAYRLEMFRCKGNQNPACDMFIDVCRRLAGPAAATAAAK